MSATYEEVRVTFPTQAAQAHPTIQSDLDTLASESEDVEILEAQASVLTVVIWYDTSIDRSDLLDELEHAHVPYDVYYHYDDRDSCPEIAWYRPHATPDHDRYPTDFDEEPVISWSTLTDLAQDSVGLTLSRIRAAAHLPPTTILDCATQAPITATSPSIPYRAIAEQFVEERGELWEPESIRNILREFRVGNDAYALASRLEDIAYATLRVYAKQKSPVSLRPAIQTAVAIARPFDDAEALLAIYTPTQIIHNRAWPTVGRLSVWRAIVDGLWDALDQWVHHAA